MPNFHDLPSVSGTYVLHLFVSRSQAPVIGRLGQQRLPASHYFYVGSARGAGGLQARVGRLLRGDGALQWHIDYLRTVAKVREVLYTVADEALECTWSKALAQLPHAFIPIPHFGSTDCRSGCSAHLIAFPRRADIGSIPRILAQTTPAPIVSLHYRRFLPLDKLPF